MQLSESNLAAVPDAGSVYRLRLYVAGQTPKSVLAFRNLKQICEQHLLGRYQIEIMANLDQVPATGALIVVAWPKVKDGLGFPARAFAILP